MVVKNWLKEGYDGFIRDMIEYGQNGTLPVTMECDDVPDIPVRDVADFIKKFNRDTLLDLNITFYMCDGCGRAHMMFDIDYPETSDKLIQ